MTSEALAVARESAAAYREALGGRLTAGYLLGSLAYGGFSSAVSDIDLALVLTSSDEGDREAVDAVASSLRERGGFYPKLSVFWASLPALREGRDDGRFPALDRLELAERSRLLIGEDVAASVARPDPGELSLESARFAVGVLSTDEVIAEFHTPRRLLADSVWFTKAVLFPVRFLCSNLKTGGRSAANGEAIEWYLSLVDAPAKSLVRSAAAVRVGAPLPAGDFAVELRELYRYYIDDQVGRVDEVELRSSFERWRERLS